MKVPQMLKLTIIRTLTVISLLVVGCSKSEVIDVENTTQYVSDIDGNDYPVVNIGDQCWMAENLKTTRYRNGDSISHLIDTTSWKFATEGGWCWYNNVADYDAVFGKLYNARALDDSRNICPEGWHIPNLTEWYNLVSYLDPATLPLTDWENGSYVVVSDSAGAQLKDGGLYWVGSDINPNVSGFNALPVGTRRYNGNFGYETGIGYYASFWSSHRTQDSFGSTMATYFSLYYADATVAKGSIYVNQGKCVRCIKDQ